MGFFSNVKRVVGDVVGEVGDAIGDTVEGVGDAVLGERGQRGERIGEAIGGYVGGPVGAEIGGRIGQAVSDDIAAAPEVERARRERNRTTDDLVLSENPFENTGEVITAGVPGPSRNEDFDTGTVIDIRYKNPIQEAIVGTGMDFLEEVGDFFFGDDDNQPASPSTGMQSGMRMCPPGMPKAFNVNKTTGCVTITRRQQAKLREAVRMFGGAQVASNLGISNQLLQQLLLKTFRARRRGISGADIRAVKRVDRQMHSLAMALGGISSTSKAVVGRRSPTKR